VVLAELATSLDAGGVVQARTTAPITARVLAPVRDVLVAPGDRVRAGQTLVLLDGDDLAAAARAARSAASAAEQGADAAAAALEEARAGLALARASHDRIAALRARQYAAAQQLDEAVAALRSAEARVAGASARASQAALEVERARAASDQATVTASFSAIAAPFDGVVTETMVERGRMALPGVPLLRLEDTRAFRLEVRVDESRVARIRTGDRVPVFLDADSSPIAGTVEEVSRAVDADLHAFLVKIALPAVPGLRSGEFGKARLPGAPRRALTVPPSAVVHRGQVTSVFVVEGGRARLRLVDQRDSDVVAGLAEAELVILSPPPGLTDGRRILIGGR
jgi:multidrug efflux pump subunit AcrA (membrane-fusion protein)